MTENSEFYIIWTNNIEIENNKEFLSIDALINTLRDILRDVKLDEKSRANESYFTTLEIIKIRYISDWSEIYNFSNLFKSQKLWLDERPSYLDDFTHHLARDNEGNFIDLESLESVNLNDFLNYDLYKRISIILKADYTCYYNYKGDYDRWWDSKSNEEKKELQHHWKIRILNNEKVFFTQSIYNSEFNKEEINEIILKLNKYKEN